MHESSWLPALAVIESSGLRRAYDFKTDGDRYLWTYRKRQELRAVDKGALWVDAASALAREPVQAAHRRQTLASRRKPFPPSTVDDPPGQGS